VPPGLPLYPFLIFWLFHHLRIFANREYTVLLIREGDRVVHNSTLVPTYFRYPFMGRNDVQIGTWTAPDHRGRGLARLALKQAMALTRRRSGRIWFIVKEVNLPSVRIAATSGLTLIGCGCRVSRFGLEALGKFVLESPAFSEATLKERSTNQFATR
jgi:RimJ/RimL family protein N-acetyltransferase